MEHRNAEGHQVAAFSASGDDNARFLRELRQLRDSAGLGHAELAARAHYPYDSIRAAEVGPALPDLPVLSAFVRACGGTTEEWEERWRSLTKSPSLPVSHARQTGLSDAAAAGARINSVPINGDTPDPSLILKALNRVAEEMATPGMEMDITEAEMDIPGVKPTGWDPIRVSSAWPALTHTPTVASSNGSVSAVGSSGGAGAPWDAAAWAADPADAAPTASPSPAAPGLAASAETPSGATAATATDATAGPSGSRGWSRATIAVIAALLLCVLAGLLVLLA